MRGRVIIDPFRMLNHENFKRVGFSIATLGVKTEFSCQHKIESLG